MTLDYQQEFGRVESHEQAILHFHSLYYLRLNQRRQEHLATLGLPLAEKHIWEVSAGIGDHTTFFIDPGCRVTCTEARSELVECLSERFPNIEVRQLDLDIR
jgi:16S rRNA A1518/A1519 N6-dimethyltransferase RsmA/KsgA/DIM1 with predicted DNA glycosylase/AP lyase activity